MSEKSIQPKVNGLLANTDRVILRLNKYAFNSLLPLRLTIPRMRVNNC
jgi:hypothetical protein